LNYDNLKEALALYNAEWLASLPSEEEAARMYTPSLRFLRRMERLFSRQRKPYYIYVNRPWKRALLTAIVALMLFGASMSVSAVREPVIHFIVVVYEKFTALLFQTEQKIDESVFYRPAYLPEGFTLAKEETTKVVMSLYYENAEGAEILFRQYPLHSPEVLVDTEGVAVEDANINGHQGVFYRNKNYSDLIWSTGKHTFLLSADLDKSSMARIAKSVHTAE